MRNGSGLLISALVLAGCASIERDPDFAAMDETELAQYNLGLPYAEQVFCRDQRRTGSLLRQRVCMTLLEDYIAKRRDMQMLQTINSGPLPVGLR